ncbi:porin [Thauera sinica]|uniref:Porin n=1 Tax=Thauera sinica TaxID=2665146 RepID=A0ABW1AP17_9RHOO|nr:porin [Thauera sp. K11]ATE59478.1 porin [Thauera sp. K11]
MQKRLFALAVAGLAGAPAFAQSSVTIFGTVDVGYRFSGDNIDSRVKNRSAIDSGTSTPTRLGFRGNEDLGNGLQAGFVLEQGIAADTGTSAGGGTFSRQAFVSLAGAFGTLGAGRQYTPGYVLTSTVDPFSGVTVGQYNNVYLSEYRWDNLVTYVSPSWGGFSVTAAFTLDGYGNESPGNRGAGDVGDVRALSILPQYRSGPLHVGLHIQDLRAKSTGLYDGDKVRVYDLAGTYDFGVAKLAAAYGIRRADNGDFSPDTGATEGEKTKQWFVGVTVPAGAAGKVLASYVARKTEAVAGGDDAKAGQWAVGYEHALSKRTAIHATYAKIDNNRAARDSTNLSGSVGAGYNAGDGYQTGFAAGIRHGF